MELIPIGEAAAKLGMSASALRYYDERGLVRPSARRGGKRMYDESQLRRLAFVKLAQSLGLPLDTAAAVLDEPGPRWRERLDHQIAELDRIVDRAMTARKFLTHARDCPSDHPAEQCPTMTAGLARLIAGTPVTDLIAGAAHPRPTGPRPWDRPGNPGSTTQPTEE